VFDRMEDVRDGCGAERSRHLSPWEKSLGAEYLL